MTSTGYALLLAAFLLLLILIALLFIATYEIRMRAVLMDIRGSLERLTRRLDSVERRLDQTAAMQRFVFENGRRL